MRCCPAEMPGRRKVPAWASHVLQVQTCLERWLIWILQQTSCPRQREGKRIEPKEENKFFSYTGSYSPGILLSSILPRPDQIPRRAIQLNPTLSPFLNDFFFSKLRLNWSFPLSETTFGLGAKGLWKVVSCVSLPCYKSWILKGAISNSWWSIITFICTLRVGPLKCGILPQHDIHLIELGNQANQIR